MSKILRNLAIIALFLAPCLSFGMEPDTIKIQTSDEQEFEIERHVAQTSVMLKGLIEDIKGEAAIIPATITGQQFDLLLPAMLQLAQLHTTLPQASEEKLAYQLQQIVTDLKSHEQPLSNEQLIEFIAGANYLDIPLVEPALEALARRILNKDQLESLGDKLKDFWHVHPAKKLMLEGLSPQHPWVKGGIESADGNLISWGGGTIKIWDKNNLTAELITLTHEKVNGVIESLDGNNLISWSSQKGSIKVWDKNNPKAEPITLQHSDFVWNVIESRDGNNLISCGGGTIKIWDKNNLREEPIIFRHSEVNGVGESKDGNNLISWSMIEGTIKVWDKNNLTTDPITLQHPRVICFIESLDGNKLISWSMIEGTIKIWDKNTLSAEPTTFNHRCVIGFIESLDGNNLISWSEIEGTIKIWDKNNLTAEPITLQHPRVSSVIESMNGKKLISWSLEKSTIKIWDANNLTGEPITLKHPGLSGVIQSVDGNLISWSWRASTIKVRDKNNFTAEPTILRHPYVHGVMESLDGKQLISWSHEKGTIKIWHMGFLNPTPKQMHLLLAVYFENKGNQKFELPDEKISELKATFPTLSPILDSKSFAHDALRFVYCHKWQFVGAGIAAALILKTAIKFAQK